MYQETRLEWAERLFCEALDAHTERTIDYGGGWIDDQIQAIVQALLDAGWAPPPGPEPT